MNLRIFLANVLLTLESGGNCFAISKCGTNTCARSTFYVKIQFIDLHLHFKCHSSIGVYHTFSWCKSKVKHWSEIDLEKYFISPPTKLFCFYQRDNMSPFFYQELARCLQFSIQYIHQTLTFPPLHSGGSHEHL